MAVNVILILHRLISNRIRSAFWAVLLCCVAAIIPGYADNHLFLETPSDKQPLVEAYEHIFLNGEARDRIVSAFDMARHFLPFVRSALKQLDMPSELAYLPVLESGYNPHATSPSGAAGIWQIMRNTSGELGMYVDGIIDERRDLYKSTYGALTKLRADYDRFGSWELSLAAYNCGSNCLQKAIDETGLTDYWALADAKSLPPETVAYVPKLLALLNLVERANTLGYANWRPHNHEWALLPVPEPVHIKFLSDAAGVDFNLLILGNAELLAGATPGRYLHIDESTGKSRRSVYHLKVPGVYAEIISNTLHDPEVQMVEYMVHRIKPGDTLSSIARRYRISVDSVRNYNPDVQPRFLQINSTLIIPGVEYTMNAHRHVVQTGETLWGIAMLYDTSVESLTRLNKIDNPNRIYPGLLLSVPKQAN